MPDGCDADADADADAGGERSEVRGQRGAFDSIMHHSSLGTSQLLCACGEARGGDAGTDTDTDACACPCPRLTVRLIVLGPGVSLSLHTVRRRGGVSRGRGPRKRMLILPTLIRRAEIERAGQTAQMVQMGQQAPDRCVHRGGRSARSCSSHSESAVIQRCCCPRVRTQASGADAVFPSPSIYVRTSICSSRALTGHDAAPHPIGRARDRVEAGGDLEPDRTASPRRGQLMIHDTER
ncbi:hypothetical protein C8Q76DRAFT_215870 [Earliella scabrosa]|nr:hypothetical protein C8Q76DRAFT_215870 [Earliella scabrosa]